MATATSSSGKTNGIVGNEADVALPEQDVDVEGEEFEGTGGSDEDGEDDEVDEEDEYDVDDEVCVECPFCTLM